MKTLVSMLSLILLIFLSGCSSFVVPMKYDSAQVEQYIVLKDYMEDLRCDQKVEEDWKKAIAKAHRLVIYSDFRDDPQLDNTKGIEKAINNAYTGSEAFCEAQLKLTWIRMDIIKKAWKDRD